MNTSRVALFPISLPNDIGRSPESSARRSDLSIVRAGGFVLVAVLLLVALVTVLVVGTSMLARIERGAVSSETSTETARQNALFGLNVALSQLQKSAGPDQAITARADILDSNPSTSATDGFPIATTTQPNNPGQAYWTGVWKTGSAPPDAYYTAALPTPSSSPTPQRTTSLGIPNPSGPLPSPSVLTALKVQKATWLVSDPIDSSLNPPGPAVLDPTATPSPVLSKTVTLAKNLPDLTGKSTTVNVGAPLVSMYPTSATAANPTGTPSGTATGKYAYWVSDEGVKAKVNLNDPTYTGAPSNSNSSFVESQLHFVGPQAVATQDGLIGTNANDIRDPKYAPDVPKVSTLQSLGYVQGTASVPFVTGVSGSAAAAFSPDVTTSSYGVLANVRNGGLKTDLSQLFEDPANQFSPFLTALGTVQTAEYAGDQKVWAIIAPSFDANNSQSLTDFGVRWQSLYNYYSLYKNKSVYPSSGPWSNINSYSSNTPGTPTPSLDARFFSYTSNPTGASGGMTYQEMGENYAPQVIGFGIYFSMSSVQLTATGSNPHDYSLIMYAEPQLILYNPFNVTLMSPTPYTVSLNTNVLGHAWIVSVAGNSPSATVLKEAPTWNGTGNNDITFVTSSTANYALKPGEIRVYGLGTLAQVSLGNIANFSGTTTVLGDKVGQCVWQYVGTDQTLPAPNTAGSAVAQWKANVPDNADVTVNFAGNSSLWSNDGRYNLKTTGPGVWPTSGTANTSELGRFFNDPFHNEVNQTADLGPISGLATSTPNPSAAKPFGYFVIRAKGLTQGESSFPGMANLPVFSSADGAFCPIPTFFDDPTQDTDFALAVQNPTSLTEMQVTGGPSPPFNSFWGSQDVALNANDPNFLVLRDVPRQPMVSVGQFMHMPLRTSTRVYYPNNLGEIDTNSCLMGTGGSLADPYFPLTQVTGNGDYTTNNINKGVASFDDNFLMNQALFDSYYFSTVPLPKTAPDASHPAMDLSYTGVLPAMSSGTSAFTDANIQSGTCVLPNARMRFYAKNGVPPQTTTATATNYLSNYRKSAANLLLNGAFNVNSTSMPAWRALLSSLAGNNPTAGLYSSTLSETGYSSGALYPVFRFLSPVSITGNGTSSAVTSLANPFLWASINILTDTTNVSPPPSQPVTQVTALATAIVKQVKRLGPFLSMADFLNRRLTTATDSYGPNNTSASIGLRGALQAAIDDTNINAGILAQGSSTGATTKNSRGTGALPIIAQLPNNTAIGVPGCLMQQDLVQCFSPVMTVRSDTFLVRCYGEADNLRTGVTQGRAWGEAIVQRLPDFVDQSDPALSASSGSISGALGDATPIASVSVTNQTLGRRFKVVSFRWLNESDL